MLVLFIVAYSEREQPHKCQRQGKKDPPITRIILNLQANNKHIKETRGKWIKSDGEQQKSESIWTLFGPFSIVFFLLPPSTPFSPYPYYVPLQVRSFPPLLALFCPSFLSAPLCSLMSACVVSV